MVLDCLTHIRIALTSSLLPTPNEIITLYQHWHETTNNYLLFYIKLELLYKSTFLWLNIGLSQLLAVSWSVVVKPVYV